jgi:hypothetical protein
MQESTMSQVSLPRPAPVEAPRFAAVAADWFSRALEVAHLGQRVRSMRRAQAERIAEAAEVRRLADAMMEADPRFAADLYAAADRHDRGM